MNASPRPHAPRRRHTGTNGAQGVAGVTAEARRASGDYKKKGGLPRAKPKSASDEHRGGMLSRYAAPPGPALTPRRCLLV